MSRPPRVTPRDPAAAEPWIASGGLVSTHAAVRGRAARAAAGFRSLGIGEGDTIAILLDNGTPFLEASLGAGLAGARPVPIDLRRPAEDVAFILRDCGARLAVATAPTPLPAGMRSVVVDTVAGWERWVAAHPPILAPAAARGALIYTSGTTGRPKGVRRVPAPPGHRPARALAVYGFDRPGRIIALIDGPLAHAVPDAYARLALGAGADIVLRPRVDPEATLAAVARHAVTHLHLPPSAMAGLLALPEAEKRRHDLSSLRHVVHGGAPCPPHIRRAAADWWGPVLHEYYGSTETGLLTFHSAAEALAKPGSVGRPLPGVALRILDPDGGPLPPGAVGTVHAAADGAPSFATAGDLGWLDRDGALFLAGRASDALRVGGVTVHPAAVEAALSALAGVGDCAALGAAGADGEELVACVSPLPGARLDPAALRAALAARLEPASVPARVLVVDALPREDTGKLVRRRLRAMVASRDA